MTGTAATEEEEFRKIYGLDVVVIPTNKPMVRADAPDAIYRTEPGKFAAAVEEISAIHATGQPVLVGTISIEKSEVLSGMLKRRGIPHQVLNAKFHEQEAKIIAQAGRLGMVTLATNMAGRGTDIILGGNPEYLAKEELLRRGLLPRWCQRQPSMACRRLRKWLKLERNTGCWWSATGRIPKPSTSRWWPWAACTLSAPSAMKAGASTTSCEAVPDARGTRGGPGSTSPWRTT